MSLALTDWMRHDSVITIRTWNWVVAVAVCAWLEKLARASALATRNALKVSMTVSLQVGPPQRRWIHRLGARQGWSPRSNWNARQAPSMMCRAVAAGKRGGLPIQKPSNINAGMDRVRTISGYSQVTVPSFLPAEWSTFGNDGAAVSEGERDRDGVAVAAW
ncbi:hypothetical protein [Stenotrophomonas sp. ATCM1_4]|uniref:hypothetical protein n=1 Tax=Stenotrophomonas sp. ATCM1_4 TaxID=2259330 RepID=UPI0014050334|nr:hypothetical protein [Stenotrophomonas sp. ATCM1_4]